MRGPFDGYDLQACRERIRARNAELNAVLHVIDAPVRAGDAGLENGSSDRPIAGVPYVLKDTWDTAGIPTTGGSWRHLDRRVHPNTAILLGAVFALRAVHRDKARAVQKVADVRARVRAIWDAGALIVSPTCTLRPPMHGRAALHYRLMSFCKLGNLVDATGLAIPFGFFPGTPRLPRSLQILGPPGSEDAVLDLGERLLSATG